MLDAELVGRTVGGLSVVVVEEEELVGGTLVEVELEVEVLTVFELKEVDVMVDIEPGEVGGLVVAEPEGVEVVVVEERDEIEVLGVEELEEVEVVVVEELEEFGAVVVLLGETGLVLVELGIEEVIPPLDVVGLVVDGIMLVLVVVLVLAVVPDVKPEVELSVLV